MMQGGVKIDFKAFFFLSAAVENLAPVLKASALRSQTSGL
jgi:hypothetical protein